MLFHPAPPSIKRVDSDLPEEVIVLVNKTAMLDCIVSGTPTPKITWLKDGQRLEANAPYKLLGNGRTLQVLLIFRLMRHCYPNEQFIQRIQYFHGVHC